MATYYISNWGSDSNNGLGPDPTHASNKPWLTIAKALGAAGIASGDTVYLCPGTYRELVTVNMTSATVETKVVSATTLDKSHCFLVMDAISLYFSLYPCCCDRLEHGKRCDRAPSSLVVEHLPFKRMLQLR